MRSPGVLLLGYGAAWVWMIKAGRILVQLIYSRCSAAEVAGAGGLEMALAFTARAKPTHQ